MMFTIIGASTGYSAAPGGYGQSGGSAGQGGYGGQPNFGGGGGYAAYPQQGWHSPHHLVVKLK